MAPLPTIRLTAHNYADDSENKIHSDETARVYGFRGGLVPGIGAYAYLTRPVVEALGRDWLERGSGRLRLLHPVYHGDAIRVEARVAGAEPPVIAAEVRDSADVLCATLEAALDPPPPPPDPAAYPRLPLPALDRRIAPSVEALPEGTPLGSRELRLDLALARRTFVKDMLDDLPIYLGESGACHPALLLAQANYIARDNIDLGPWIHAASEFRHFASPRDGELLSLRGRVARSYERKGHQFAEFDLAIFGEADRPIMTILHTAIIRPRRRD